MRWEFEKFLPDDMQKVVRNFHHERPRSGKYLIDTCFSGDDFSNVSWDMLYDLDGKETAEKIIQETKDEHTRKRQLMAERAKARENW